MESDPHLREPRPLQVVMESSRTARLYLAVNGYGLAREG